MMTPAGAFGTNKPAFGATSASGGNLSFGTPTSTPAFGSTFGTPATSAPAFGTTFGTPASSTPAFGTGFGTPATSASTFGSAFGAASAAPTFGTGFGAPITSAPPAFGTSFATPATSAPPAFGSNFSGFGFGGATTTSVPSTGLSFGTTSNAPATGGGLGGFSFGTSTTTTSAPSGLNFSFGLAGAPNSQAGLGGGLNFGKPLTTQADAAKPAASLGLGGVDSSTSLNVGATPTSLAASGPGNRTFNPRLISLPQELALAVDDFKNCIRQRKQISSDIARISIRPLHKVKSDADAMLLEVNELNAKLSEKRRAANNLRSRAAAALPAAERAHRTAEAPHGVEYESGDAIAWIAEVVGEGEERLRLLKRQLEAAQKQLSATPRQITDQELALGMKRIHDSFVAVAGRLYAIHELVEAQKTQYLALRRNVFKDTTDVFAKANNHNSSSLNLSSSMWHSRNDITKILPTPPSAVVSDPLAALGVTRAKANTLGPTPFSLLGPPGFGGLNFPPKPPNTATNTLGNSSWNFSNPGNLSTTSQGLGNLSWFSNSGTAGDTSLGGFNLQKPPAGNKRGKH